MSKNFGALRQVRSGFITAVIFPCRKNREEIREAYFHWGVGEEIRVFDQNIYPWANGANRKIEETSDALKRLCQIHVMNTKNEIK